MEYTVRKARHEDLPRIEDIYAYARSFMAQTGNPNQWGKTHPPVEQLKKDIEAGKLHVVVSDEIHGVFYFARETDPTYLEIFDGGWHSDQAYGVIHRIAGVGGGVFAAALEYCSGVIGHLRIDTHADNKPMQHVVEKAGFSKRGIIYVEDGTPRIAYDRI